MVSCPECKSNNVMSVMYSPFNKKHIFECQECEHRFEDIITAKEG